MIEIRQISGPLGAEVINLDLSSPVPEHVFRRIYDAYLKYGVLVFRNQMITPEQHIEFSTRFGELALHPIESLRVGGHPELLRVPDKSNYDPVNRLTAQIPWHTDLSYVLNPSTGALLHGIEVPPTNEGGATGFVDTIQVYEWLSPERQSAIRDLKVVHRFSGTDENRVTAQRLGALVSEDERQKLHEVVHPLVTIHPELKLPNLFISCLYACEVVEMDEAEGKGLLRQLTEFATHQRFVYMHQWQNNDLVAWDNRRTMHLASGHSGLYPRVMQKTTIKGQFTD